MPAKIVLIVHDVRSCHNVGSLLRTADGLGLTHTYLTGYTPYPEAPNDDRLPHVRARAVNQIHKTALGAEDTTPWSHETNVAALIKKLRADGYLIAALEQTDDAKNLAEFKSDKNIALILGSEVEGLATEVIDLTDIKLEIPMLGAKESFNVSVAAAMALYHLRYDA